MSSTKVLQPNYHSVIKIQKRATDVGVGQSKVSMRQSTDKKPEEMILISGVDHTMNETTSPLTTVGNDEILSTTAR